MKHYTPSGIDLTEGTVADVGTIDLAVPIAAPSRSVRSALGRFVMNTPKRPTLCLLAGRVVQLLNSVLLSAVVVRRFGLSMVGTYALGYIAVAFIPHILSLGLNSELPRTRRPLPELIYIAAAFQAIMFVLLLPGLYLYARLMARSDAETVIVLTVSMFGCFTGMFNVGLTLNILRRSFSAAFTSPLIETVSIGAGMLLAHTGLALACMILAGKAVSVMFLWPRSRMRLVPWGKLLPIARQGTKYLALDLMAALSDQLPPLILGIAAPRAELGLYRLCQQTMSAAETPGWSYVQGKYPEMTQCDERVNGQIERHQIKIGLGAAALCAVGSVPLAYLLFHTPVVARMMLVLSVALPSRYIIYVNDQRLRAEGRVSPSAALVLARIVLCGTVLLLMVNALGVWAGIWTAGLTAVLFSWVYQRVTHSGEVGAPASSPSTLHTTL